MTVQFNLVTSPWVPVRYKDRSALVSLETLFAEAKSIVDLDCAPHERIAIMRLLVCITQTVFEPPEDSGSWDGYAAGMDIQVPLYLKRENIYPHFELFGDGPRFLQVAIDRRVEPVSASKLIPHLATGNNPTLFDQNGGESGRIFEASTLAKALLTFQCFYPLYGAGYKGKGPCVDGNMLHTLLLGRNIRETIVLNCLDRELIRRKFRTGGIGKPIWRLDPADSKFEEIATLSYLGRLVPRHRSLWLLENGSGFYLQKEGILYPTYEEAIEPTATIVSRKKKDGEERRLLAARLDKAAWRDLHAVTVLKESNDELKAPLNLQSHFLDFPENGIIPIWIGALVTDLKAKILDTMESRLTVPIELFGDAGRNRYQAGIDWAEKQSNQLYGAVKHYGSTLMNESPQTDLAKQRYWTELEYNVDELLDIIRNPEQMKGMSFGEGKDPWSEAVWLAARTAYEHVCPRQTPRQLHAFIAGLKSLKPKSKTKASDKRKETAKV